MKRIFSALLLVALLTALAGCSGSEEAAPTPEPTVEAAPSPTPVPLETPAPTPIPVVELKDYTYVKLNNQALNVSFKYPSHWTNVPGVSTVSFLEPVEEGQIASRFAVTTKPYEGNMSKDILKRHAQEYSAALAVAFDKYDRGSVTTEVKMLGHAAYSFYFTGEMDGTDIRGFASVGFDKTASRLYAFNFYATSAKFPYFDVVMRTAQNSISTAT